MQFSQLVLVLVGIALRLTSVSGFQYVPLNMNSSIYSDIQSMEHHLDRRRFHIQLKPARRCEQPTFFVRLSGAALYKLDEVNDADGEYTFEYPPLVDAGEYFLDAIVLFCQAYNANDMNNQCMESVQYRKNAINDPYSFVVNDTALSAAHFPHWRNSQPPTMLPTRHQRLNTEPRYRSNCQRIIFDIYCFPEASEVEPYKNYTWVHGVKGLAAVEQVYFNYASSEGTASASGLNASAAGTVSVEALVASVVDNSINVCFVGDSHARELMLNAAEYVNTTRYITFTLVVSVFPAVFTTAMFHDYKCSVAVLCFGQWSLSKFAPTPFKLGRFSDEIETVMEKIDAYQVSGGTTKVFFRTDNYNGLAAKMTKCPHEDFRTVPAFDALNAVVRDLCANHSVPFIDLHRVIGPMWDAALDYSHPIHHVLRAEVDVILHAVFSHVIRRNWVLQTHPVSALQRMHEEDAHLTFTDRSQEQMHRVHGHA